MPHFMILLIPYVNLINLSWLKMSIFKEYDGAFKERLACRRLHEMIIYDASAIVVSDCLYKSICKNNVVGTHLNFLDKSRQFK